MDSKQREDESSGLGQGTRALDGQRGISLSRPRLDPDCRILPSALWMDVGSAQARWTGVSVWQAMGCPTQRRRLCRLILLQSSPNYTLHTVHEAKMASRSLARSMATLTRSSKANSIAPVTISYRALCEDPLSLSHDIGTLA